MATQLITPNPNIACTPGWCLVYVRETFGIGPKYPTAIAGWNGSSYKHQDQNFPAGVSVPIWFSLDDNPAGHVALLQPDGSVWSSSSPTSTIPVHHPSLASIINYYGGHRLNYLGWTEDIEGVQIMNGAESAVVQRAVELTQGGTDIVRITVDGVSHTGTFTAPGAAVCVENASTPSHDSVAIISQAVTS